MQTSKLIKHTFVTTALSSVMLASAATLSGAADVPPRGYNSPAPYFLWTGLYIGANAGMGWFESDGNSSDSGFVGGGQIGYNYQIGHWVWGAELEISGANIKDTGLDSTISLMAKGGYAFDRWLVYGKFGGGWLNFSGPGIDATGTAAVFGVGTEYALTHNWSVKAEYNFWDGGDVNGHSSSFQTIKGGINYKFGPGWPF